MLVMITVFVAQESYIIIITTSTAADTSYSYALYERMHTYHHLMQDLSCSREAHNRLAYAEAIITAIQVQRPFTVHLRSVGHRGVVEVDACPASIVEDVAE
jgi:fumarate reductase subunit D